MTDYWDSQSKAGRVAAWAGASQVQFERWEPLVAQQVAAAFDAKYPMPSRLVWQMDMERHFLLVAIDHLMTALKFAQFPVQMPMKPAIELENARNLIEHWQEHMPTFNSTPRPQLSTKYPSASAFAVVNPTGTPFSSLEWGSTVGPKLLPRVTADEVKRVVEAVTARLVLDHPNLAPFFHEWEPSPWIGGDDPSDKWFPAVMLPPAADA